jgi:pyrroline-5-carboxylate reductase
MSEKKLSFGIIGVGKMGSALAYALKEDFPLLLYDKFRVPDDLKNYERKLEDVLSESDIIILAVKPKDIYDVLSDVADLANSNYKLVVSCAAGIRSDLLRRYIKRWARIMPSLTISQKEGVLAILAGLEEDAKILENIFKKYSKTFVVKSDDEIDIFTATSASGPGYLSVIFEAFEDAIVRVGLPRSVAREVSVHTFLGIAKMIISGKAPSQIKEEVMTPGGTTAEAIVEINDVRKTIFLAVEKALMKSKLISDELSYTKK